ncbi:DNA adenine methylase [Streptococcus suis]
MSTKSLKPLFKYPGGKSTEYKYFNKLFPKFTTYIEPFLGGGSVFWAVGAKNWIINDLSEELIAIYQYSKTEDKMFLQYLSDIGNMWEEKNFHSGNVVKLLQSDVEIETVFFDDIVSKLFQNIDALPKNGDLSKLILDSIIRKRKSLERVSKKENIKNWEDNALGALGSAVYTYLREIYNHTSFSQNPQLKAALYLFIREYCYSSMFRYNVDGMFNVPFGGNTYAKKDFSERFRQITDSRVIAKLKKTTIHRGDFTEVFIDQDDTFMFLDPPYDSEFSTYNLHVFDAREQVRLRDSLLEIKLTKWMMVVKSTEFIEELYDQEGWYKLRFDKTYSVNFKNRNAKDVTHLVITNYRMEDL